MRILKYNLNLAFNTFKHIMAFGVSTLQVAPRSQPKKTSKVAKEIGQENPAVDAPEITPVSDTPVVIEESINQISCDGYVLSTNEVEVLTSNPPELEFEVSSTNTPEAEFEVEVVSSNIGSHRTKTKKNQRRANYSHIPSGKISTISRRSRLWAKQMRRRRRMSLFDCMQRSRLRCSLSKRWNAVKSPISARVDAKILQLLQNKRKQLKRDGLYQFVLWREAVKAERNRLLEFKSILN